MATIASSLNSIADHKILLARAVRWEGWSMGSHLFWLDDCQWNLIAPLLPEKQRGPKRHDDRKILSGIFHVLQSGCAWRACPREYGPHMTVFNRFNRWKRKGVWREIGRALDSDATLAGVILCERAGEHLPTQSLKSGRAWQRSRLPPEEQPDAAAGVVGLNAAEGLELALQILVMLECVAFYAAGSSDGGARAKAAIQAFKMRTLLGPSKRHSEALRARNSRTPSSDKESLRGASRRLVGPRRDPGFSHRDKFAQV